MRAGVTLQLPLVVPSRVCWEEERPFWSDDFARLKLGGATDGHDYQRSAARLGLPLSTGALSRLAVFEFDLRVSAEGFDVGGGV